MIQIEFTVYDDDDVWPTDEAFFFGMLTWAKNRYSEPFDLTLLTSEPGPPPKRTFVVSSRRGA